jgi:hypothetical protein
MSDGLFTFAFKFGRAEVTAYMKYDNSVDLSEWQLALNCKYITKTLFENETEARHTATAFLKDIIIEENTYHTPDRPVSARWRVYKLEQADHGTIFWHKGNTVE